MKGVGTLAKEIASRVKQRRKERKPTQEMLSKKSGISFGSVNRFETQEKNMLVSKISIALECEADFDEPFVKKYYRLIQEVMDERNSRT